MAEPPNDMAAPSTQDIEMKEEAAEVAGATEDEGALPISQPFAADSAVAQTTQALPPPVAQAPSVSPLPATAAAPIAASLPISAPTPSPAPTRPSSIPPTISLPPEQAREHGSTGRVYLNNLVTYYLEGMKYLIFYRPEKPLKWMGEFLLKRSAEIEGE
ncbi:unnamed protein product [Aureobasidium vineae]|uniref:Uncharacterized protein n=1 Tax=Aureobasidium vineae TaxID=2773715 RepID=A0A9N8JDZ3_9PEZI|nr:unnamed protein product [Aureobasidium vineae]